MAHAIACSVFRISPYGVPYFMAKNNHLQFDWLIFDNSCSESQIPPYGVPYFTAKNNHLQFDELYMMAKFCHFAHGAK